MALGDKRVLRYLNDRRIIVCGDSCLLFTSLLPFPSVTMLCSYSANRTLSLISAFSLLSRSSLSLLSLISLAFTFDLDFPEGDPVFSSLFGTSGGSPAEFDEASVLCLSKFPSVSSNDPCALIVPLPLLVPVPGLDDTRSLTIVVGVPVLSLSPERPREPRV